MTRSRDLDRPRSDGARAAINELLAKYMTMLQVAGPLPDVVVQSNLGARWLGRCEWRPSWPTSRIQLQRSILGHPATLERVVAHEMIHHKQNMELSPGDVAALRLGIRPAGHGDWFLAQAGRVNAVMGEGFVTVTSDQQYVQAKNEKPFFLLIWPHIHGVRMKSPDEVLIDDTDLGYAWAGRLSAEAQRDVEKKVALGGRLVKTTDTQWCGVGKIGKWTRFAVPSTPERKAALRALWESAS